MQGLNEEASSDIADYEGRLAQTETQSRRELLVQALQLAQAMGATNESNQLQRELAALDAQIRREGLGLNYAQLGQQQGQFEDTMGLNYNQLLAQMNREALLAGMA